MQIVKKHGKSKQHPGGTFVMEQLRSGLSQVGASAHASDAIWVLHCLDKCYEGVLIAKWAFLMTLKSIKSSLVEGGR